MGLSASSALISPIMPPSIPAVVFASVAAVSTGALFAAAVIPAILMTIALCITIWVWARNKTQFQGEPYDWPAARHAVLRALPAMGAPVLILGGILGGFFTPTEAAGIGALYMLVLAVSYRTVVGARHGPDHARHVDRDGPDHDHHRCVVTAQLDPRQGAGAAGRRRGPAGPDRQPGRLPADHQRPADRPRDDPRADVGAPDHHADPAPGRGRVRDRPAAVRLDRHLQPDDRPAHAADGRCGVRAQLGDRDPARTGVPRGACTTSRPC